MSKSLWDLLNEYKPNIIYMEETYSAKNAQTTKFLTRLQGVVYAWCLNNKCEFNTIIPSSWRKLLGFMQGRNITRKQLKDQSIKYVTDIYSLDVTDDEADAICIGEAVIRKYGEMSENKNETE